MRRTQDYTIDLEGRDKGRTYRITEKPAYQAHMWAVRVTNGLLRMGFSPSGIADLGNPGSFGLIAFLDPADARWAIDAMLADISIIPDPKNMHFARPLDGDDIEEIHTMSFLVQSAMVLNLGFTGAAGNSPQPVNTPAASQAPLTPSGKITRTKPRT